MKYMGSKRRIAKHIIPLMTLERERGQYWVEPFVGGGNSIAEVRDKRIGADIHAGAIQALTLIRDHPELLPRNNTEFTEDDYKRVKHEPEHYLHGYAGFNFSFGSRFFEGWARCKIQADYVTRAYKSAIKQHAYLQGVQLIHSAYNDLFIPQNAVIYCDPPYEGTTSYKHDFNHSAFWSWVRKMSKSHQVFVSEYNAPSDFVELWSMDVTTNLDNKSNEAFKATERLFAYKDGQVNIDKILSYTDVRQERLL